MAGNEYTNGKGGEDLAEKSSSANQYKSGKGLVQSRDIYIFPKREATSAKFYAHVQVSTKSVQTMTSLEIVDMINKERAALFANGQAKKYV
ncbi:hypothetical protein GIV47_08570, partial [Pseudomonas marginalis]|uniref:hypothetical protein n=1 Tax=Pseudomonas marginalis TaxID=298 RepID=UPI001F46F618